MPYFCSHAQVIPKSKVLVEEVVSLTTCIDLITDLKVVYDWPLICLLLTVH